jgi:hypothetical protein
MVVRSVTCQWCTRYGHQCSGDVGKICGRCVRDWQACVSPEGERPSTLFFRSPSPNSEVVIRVAEFRRKAAAKAEKDRKMKEKAKDAAKGKKVSLPVAGPSKPLGHHSRTLLLFSAWTLLRLTWQLFPKAREGPPRGVRGVSKIFWSSRRRR